MAPTGSNTKNYFTYIGLRLCAVIGVLLFVETLYKSFWQASYSNVFRSYNATAATTSEKSRAIIAPMLVGEEASHTWIREFEDWEHHIFTVDDPRANETVAKNKGQEASVYLTYIIEHYFSLPDYMVFVHGKRYEWHTDDPMYDTSRSIQQLKLDHVEDEGYASLRCAWAPGCPLSIEPDPTVNDGIFGIISEYYFAWEIFFPGVPVPETVAAPCCAQFAVSKAQVLQRPVSDYERYRQWLWDTGLPGGRSGRIMEYMWHVIFGKEAILCPDTEECYCKKFGLCDLDCREEGKCEGRYWDMGVDTTLPKGWPEQGQGERGWPKDHWWDKEEDKDEEKDDNDEDKEEKEDNEESKENKEGRRRRRNRRM